MIMKKTIIFIASLLFTFLFNAFSQSSKFYDTDDVKQRGYYNRAYLRYEAEPDSCTTNSDDNFLLKSFNQANIESEASNQTAIKLADIGDYVEWRTDADANGVVIRFSIPDNTEGTGTKATISLYADGIFQQKINLNSYWGWQYFTGSENVAYNYPKNGANIIRMRFDETHVLLNNTIPAEAILTLKIDNDDVYTDHIIIDFVELENVAPAFVPDDTYIIFEGDKDTEDDVIYDNEGRIMASTLNNFIATNGGNKIFIPAGIYNIPERLYINYTNTTLQGAGMWYTELYFSAPLTQVGSDRIYSKRGIESTNNNNINIDGFYLNTINNIRYYERNSGKQVGKGLNGSFGSNSVITNLWIEHFECGAWLEGTQNLQIAHSRFRNNYADGINLCAGASNNRVQYCNFRNNGDDDMASWSRSNRECFNNLYQYCTSENCWRAAGIGFFGGKQNKAYQCVVKDAVETGLRVDATFDGAPFSSEGFTEFFEISVYCGGTNKNIWNAKYGAITISMEGAKYNLKNISFKNIDLIESKQNAIYLHNLGSTSSRTMYVCMENINIDGTKATGTGEGNGILAAYGVKGYLIYKNIEFKNINGKNITNNAGKNLTLESTDEDPCEEIILVKVDDIEMGSIKITSGNGTINISGLTAGNNITIFDITGNKTNQTTVKQEREVVSGFNSGVYIVSIDDYKPVKVIVQ